MSFKSEPKIFLPRHHGAVCVVENLSNGGTLGRLGEAHHVLRAADLDERKSRVDGHERPEKA